MSRIFAYCGADIFDGRTTHQNCALLVEGAQILAILPMDDLPRNVDRVTLQGGVIVPGLLDLQVNGGGGVMLNDAPTVETIRTICAAHGRFGTTALLPTLISDTPAVTRAALDAAKAAHAAQIPGFAGLHLEGPHLAIAKKGAHQAAMIRKMTEQDCAMLEAAAQSLPTLLVTLAPESVTPHQVARLKKAGAIISLGHTNCSYEAALGLVESGARAVTHLFNAMPALTGRAPSVVGLTLENNALFAGLIADGFHVSPVNIRIALKAKQGPGRLFLVSDAMATTGSKITEFTLNGRKIYRGNGRLVLEDGTLAGADLDLFSAMRYMQDTLEIDLPEVARMASLYPAELIKRDNHFGRLEKDRHADFIWIRPDNTIGCIIQHGINIPPFNHQDLS